MDNLGTSGCDGAGQSLTLKTLAEPTHFSQEDVINYSGINRGNSANSEIKQGSEDKKVNKRPNNATPERTVNISALNKNELLSMIQGYLNSMISFTNKNRNVHRKLKDTLANIGRVLNQYTKVKNTRVNNEACKST